MGNGQIGGDSSVKWYFRGDNVRRNTTTPKSNPTGTHGHEQEAIDETNAGECFTVTIKLPQDSSALLLLLNQLKNWVNNPIGPIVFQLPIEDNNERQIVIEWNSKPGLAVATARSSRQVPGRRSRRTQSIER